MLGNGADQFVDVSQVNAYIEVNDAIMNSFGVF